MVLPLGFMMFAMIIINEIPDRPDDAAAGKNTLVVIFGADRAGWLYGFAMLTAYAIIVLAPLFGVAGIWIYPAVLTLPWTIQAFHLLRKNVGDPARLVPANLLTIRIHHLTGMILIIAYLIHGLQNQREFQSVWFVLMMLAVFYLPAAVSIFFGKKMEPSEAV